jgi:hypothetical protein
MKQKIVLKDKKKLRKQINGKFNTVGSKAIPVTGSEGP